jgi:hypothetical protein
MNIYCLHESEKQSFRKMQMPSLTGSWVVVLSCRYIRNQQAFLKKPTFRFVFESAQEKGKETFFRKEGKMYPLGWQKNFSPVTRSYKSGGGFS